MRKLKISSCNSKVYIVFSGLTVTTEFNVVPPRAEILEAGQPWRLWRVKGQPLKDVVDPVEMSALQRASLLRQTL